ncbi:MAG: hypothetical protein ACYDEX_01160, partial [Mobilitalea sp.]
MITQQERDNINQGFENIHYGISQLLSIHTLIEDKKDIVKKLISNRFSQEIQYFEVVINDFLNSKDKIILLENNYSTVPTIENEITEHFITFLF